MTNFQNAKQAASHFRSFLKDAGIGARCRITPGDGRSVQVFPPAYGVEFTEAEQRSIRSEAANVGLTWVRGTPIDVERMTDPNGMEFYL